MQEIHDLKAAIAAEFDQFRTELEGALAAKSAAEDELATYKAEIVQLAEEVRAPGIFGQPPALDEDEGAPVDPEPGN